MPRAPAFAAPHRHVARQQEQQPQTDRRVHRPERHKPVSGRGVDDRPVAFRGRTVRLGRVVHEHHGPTRLCRLRSFKDLVGLQDGGEVVGEPVEQGGRRREWHQHRKQPVLADEQRGLPRSPGTITVGPHPPDRHRREQLRAAQLAHVVAGLVGSAGDGVHLGGDLGDGEPTGCGGQREDGVQGVADAWPDQVPRSAPPSRPRGRRRLVREPQSRACGQQPGHRKEKGLGPGGSGSPRRGP